MRIDNTKRILNRLEEMMRERHMSNWINGTLTNVIESSGCVPIDLKRQLGAVSAVRKFRMEEGIPMDSAEKLLLLNLIENLLMSGGVRDYARTWIMKLVENECLLFDIEEFSENPYYKNIKFENHAYGDFELSYDEYSPFELQIYDEPHRLETMAIDVPRIGCFAETFRYPCIGQKSIGRTWMSVTPNEIFTMKEPLRRAKGNVLTLGCGMGYFAYMASLKDEVESVTIVEIEEDVIRLFENYILPQFENAHKIKIVKGDALQYLKEMQDGAFDYCFADIWLGIDEAESYFAVKEIGRNFKKTKMDYWIENSIATLLSGYVWVEIMECVAANNGIEVPEEMGIDTISEKDRRKWDYVKRLLADVEITRPEHLDYYMNPKNIVKMIQESEAVF